MADEGFEAELRQMLTRLNARLQNVDIEAAAKRRTGAETVGTSDDQVAINSAGTAGTYGSLTGCFGSLGSFGSAGLTDVS